MRNYWRQSRSILHATQNYFEGLIWVYSSFRVILLSTLSKLISMFERNHLQALTKRMQQHTIEGRGHGRFFTGSIFAPPSVQHTTK